MTSGADVVVVGAGIVGSAIAFHLARVRAGRVILVDAGYSGASTRRSAGVVRGLCVDPALGKLARLSLEQFASWRELVGAGCGFRRSGVVIAAHGGEAHLLGTQTAGAALTQDEFQARFPWYHLAGQSAAYLDAEGGTVDARRARDTLQAAAVRLGVRVEAGVPVARLLVRAGRVSGVRTARGELAGDVVVVAAGPWAPRLLAGVGYALPIRTIVTGLIVIGHPAVSPPMPLIDLAAGILIRPYGKGQALIGTRHAEPATPGLGSPPDFSVARMLVHLALSAPILAGGRVQNRWSGYYDMTPGARPWLGPLPTITGLLVAAGLSGGGLKLAPAIGLLMADLILTGRPSPLLSAFFPSAATSHQAAELSQALEWQSAAQLTSTSS